MATTIWYSLITFGEISLKNLLDFTHKFFPVVVKLNLHALNPQTIIIHPKRKFFYIFFFFLFLTHHFVWRLLFFETTVRKFFFLFGERASRCETAKKKIFYMCKKNWEPRWLKWSVKNCKLFTFCYWNLGILCEWVVGFMRSVGKNS